MPKLTRVLGLVAALLGFALLAGCAGGPSVSREGPAAEAPAYRVGDRWVYKGQDGFRNPVVWDEVHEVTAVGTNGITIRVTQRGPSVNTERIEELAAPGLLRKGAVFDAETRDFPKPLVRYAFPLKPGDSWRGFVENIQNPPRPPGAYSNEISHWVSVDGWAKLTTPAGTFDALRLRVSMQLDDEEFWRMATQCSYVFWYAPEVRGVVKEERLAHYYEKASTPSRMMFRSQNAEVELVSFTPGRGS